MHASANWNRKKDHALIRTIIDTDYIVCVCKNMRETWTKRSSLRKADGLATNHLKQCWIVKIVVYALRASNTLTHCCLSLIHLFAPLFLKEKRNTFNVSVFYDTILQIGIAWGGNRAIIYSHFLLLLVFLVFLKWLTIYFWKPSQVHHIKNLVHLTRYVHKCTLCSVCMCKIRKIVTPTACVSQNN